VRTIEHDGRCLARVKGSHRQPVKPGAIEFHLDGVRHNGDAVPEPSTVAATTFTTAA
jgi:predicted RNA binding protein YcfA (HicA-like mRNA interferase family)